MGKAGVAKQQVEKLAYYPTNIKVNPINTESQALLQTQSQTIKNFCNEQYSNKGHRSGYAKYVFKS